MDPASKPQHWPSQPPTKQPSVVQTERPWPTKTPSEQCPIPLYSLRALFEVADVLALLDFIFQAIALFTVTRNIGEKKIAYAMLVIAIVYKIWSYSVTTYARYAVGDGFNF